MTMKTLGRPVLTVAFALGIAAAAHAQTGAKGLYYNPQHKNDLGARFTIRLDCDERREVPETYQFHTGDAICLYLDIKNPAYVYVFNRTIRDTGAKGMTAVSRNNSTRRPSSGDFLLIFGPVLMQPGNMREIPENGALMFDQLDGIEKLSIVVSPTPLGFETMFNLQTHEFVYNENVQNAFADIDRQLGEYKGNTISSVGQGGTKNIDASGAHTYFVPRTPTIPISHEITLSHLPR